MQHRQRKGKPWHATLSSPVLGGGMCKGLSDGARLTYNLAGQAQSEAAKAEASYER